MAISSTSDLVEALSDGPLLESGRLGELTASLLSRFSDPEALLDKLVQLKWLTAYQAAQLRQGRGKDLVLGEYVLLEPLDEGGMGRVYKARERLTPRVVAVKVIRTDMLAHPHALRRFRREIQAALPLCHAHIVAAYDAAEEGESQYLVMEYVDGIDLGKLIKKSGPLPIGRACIYVRQVALGLQYLHDRGLVHRDIKPSNLILTSDGSMVKILDLGLARLLDGPGERGGGDSTQTGDFVGTPDFIAPEQVEDARTADIRADLYSLGCTFYCLLTGSVPFPGSSVIQKLDSHRWDRPRPLEQLRPAASAAVQAVAAKLMAKNPADRYQTPAELAAALDCVLESEEYRRLDGHDGRVHAVAFGPDADRALTCGADGTIRLWDLTGGNELRRFVGHTRAVLGLKLLPDGRHFLSYGADSTVRLWDLASGQELHSYGPLGEEIDCAALNPDGKALLVGTGGRTLRLWELATGEDVRHFEGHEGVVYGTSFSPDGRHCLSASADKSVRLWAVDDGREVRRFEGHDGPVYTASFSSDGRVVLSGSWDRTVRLWDAASGKELRRLEGHTLNVRDVAISYDGRRVLSGGNDQTVRLWDAAGGRQLSCFRGHAESVVAVALSSDGCYALSGSADGTARLWKLPA